MFLFIMCGEWFLFECVDVLLCYGYGEWDDCEMVMICGDYVIVVVVFVLLECYGV